jgi:excisionase family DNA binding protein
MNQFNESLTVNEAAEMIRVNPMSIYNLVRQKKIPHFKIGRKILFRRLSLEAWLQEMEQQSVIQA